MKLTLLAPYTYGILPDTPPLTANDEDEDLFELGNEHRLVTLDQLPPDSPHKRHTFWLPIFRIKNLGSQGNGAELAITDLLFHGLHKKVRSITKDTFAPYILPARPGSIFYRYHNREPIVDRSEDGAQFLCDGNYIVSGACDKLVERHNRIVRGSEERIRRILTLTEYRIIYEAPFLWEDIGEVLRWCSRIDDPSWEHRQTLKEKGIYEEAKARAIIAQLKEFASFPIKVLFLFE